MNGPFAEISQAFSDTAEKYDRFSEDHPNLFRMRSKVYAHLSNYLEPAAHILELNAGTGTDAVYLAHQGCRVHATDIAPGMLARIRDKVERDKLNDRVTVQECSFTTLDRVQRGPFDAVFSNLGGLNCIPDLRPVIRQLPLVLRPGGLVTWVLMPPICLWELALLFTGNLKVAFRRLSPTGTLAHLEGRYFKIHYFTPREVIRSFGERFTLLSIEGLSIFAPPAESKNLAHRHPGVYRKLCWLDEQLSRRPPWYGWGDFYIISLRYEPRDSSG